MTLEEAIEHTKEVAEMNRREAEELREFGEHVSPTNQPYNIAVKSCLECAAEYEQLAEWLTELQVFRKRQSQLEDEKRTLEYEKRIAWAVTNITPDEITFQGKRYILKEEE